ncbi:MAG: type I-U CRISPR-associated RAMP protein Csb1/Cas7u [Bryobacteraceae bacterium]
MKPETLQQYLSKACTGNMSALRMRVTLQPIGGNGDKVAPPTHEDGKYAFEKRAMEGRQDVPTVLLDSVQSQANRLEEALLSKIRAHEIQIPLLEVTIPNRDTLTALSVPHRVHDAIFRDCRYDGKRFRESALGKQVSEARAWNATAMFQVCPTALLFGTWDSQSESGVNSAKFARALVSEIVGVDITPGVKTSSRIDPLGIKALKGAIYKSASEQWTLDPPKSEKEKPQLYKKSGSPAEINHGNIPPSITDVENGQAGGVTLRDARQTAVLSFAQLRKLKFPVGGASTLAVDAAGRAVLAALGVYALTLQIEEGYQLRSRCQLQPVNAPEFEWLGPIASDSEITSISSQEAREALSALYQQAEKLGLSWHKEPIRLEPEPKLLKLVEMSDRSAEPAE